MDNKLNKSGEHISKFLIEFYHDTHDDIHEDGSLEEKENQFNYQQYIEEAQSKSYEIGFNEGIKAGIQKGRAEAISDSEQKVNLLLSNINMTLEQLLKADKDFYNNCFSKILTLTQVIAKKVIPYLYEQGADYEIEKTVNYIAEKMINTEPLTIRIHPSLSEKIKQLLPKLQPHKLKIDKKLDVHECQIDWVGGGVTWNNLDRFEKIEELINELIKGNKND